MGIRFPGVLVVLLALSSCGALGQTLTAPVTPLSVSVGTSVTVSWSGSTNNKNWVGLYHPGDLADSSHSSIDWKYTTTSSGSWSKTMSSAGSFEFRLFCCDGYTLYSTSATITVTNPTAVTVTPSPLTLPAAGGSVTVSWTNSNDPTNWVALYQVGDQAFSFPSSYVYTTNPTDSWTTSISAAGNYEFRLFSQNTFTRLAVSATIVAADAPPNSPPPSCPGTIPTGIVLTPSNLLVTQAAYTPVLLSVLYTNKSPPTSGSPTIGLYDSKKNVAWWTASVTKNVNCDNYVAYTDQRTTSRGGRTGYDHTDSGSSETYFHNYLPAGNYYFRYTAGSKTQTSSTITIRLPSLPVPTAYTPPRPNPLTNFNFIEMNVMAPSWAYGYSCDVSTNLRMPKVNTQLSAASTVYNSIQKDIVFLGETQVDTNANLAANFSAAGFTYFAAYHRDDFWGGWIEQDTTPFTTNGVAVAVNNAKYSNCNFYDTPLAGDGNHAAVGTCLHTGLNISVRFASVHLDTDSDKRWYAELQGIVDLFSTGRFGTIDSTHRYIDVIAGDFNAFDTNADVVSALITNLGFTSLLKSAGVTQGTYASGSSSRIDHIFVRGPGMAAVTPGTQVLDFKSTFCDAIGSHGSDHNAPRGMAKIASNGIPAPSEEIPSTGGLDSGSVAGVVVAACVCVALVALVVVRRVRSNRARSRSASAESVTTPAHRDSSAVPMERVESRLNSWWDSEANATAATATGTAAREQPPVTSV